MLRQLLREPLLYFLTAGAALFLLAAGLGDEPARRIVVTEAERARIADQWRAQMGRPPTAAELQALVDQWLREEIYYREAMAMGLAEDDTIIRRRLVQKLTFLTEDLATAAPPSEATLRDYYRNHRQQYREPARFSFEHRYFSSDRRDDAEADARAAMGTVNGSEGGAAEPPAGDPFMLQRSYVGRSRQDVAELFGREFAAALPSLHPGRWQGPVRSAYGWHLVRMEQRLPARPLAFEEVAQRVESDYRQQQRREANEAFYESLRQRYEIVDRERS